MLDINMKHSVCRIMLWECASSAGTGELVKIVGKMEGAKSRAGLGTKTQNKARATME